MMQPIVLRLPEDARSRLEVEAKMQKQSLAEIVRRAVDAYLKAKPKQKNGVEVLLDWAQRNGEQVKKSSVDSTNYKEYLYGSQSKKFGHLWKNKK